MRQEGTPTKYPGVKRVGDRTFLVRVKVTDPRTGRKRQVERLLEGVSAQEAARRRAEFTFKLKAAAAEVQRVRVGDYARSWIESKAATLDRGSADRYAEALEDHVLPALGEFFYDTLRPLDVQEWVNSALRRKKLSVETVRGWFRVFRTMTRDAMVHLELPRDPTMRISFPEPTEREEKNALLPEELDRFLVAMARLYPRHYALTVALAFTGLRFCHASALRWEDVDEKRGVIRICRKQVRGRVGPVSRRKRAPKEYPLHPEVARVLKEHRLRMLSRQERGVETGWIFPSEAGTLRCPGGLWKAWQACLKAAEISERFTVHGLRRTFTDLSRRAGVDSVITRSLTGHVTEKMREHYSSVGLDEKAAAVSGVVRLVRRPGGADGGADKGRNESGRKEVPIQPADFTPLSGAGEGT